MKKIVFVFLCLFVLFSCSTNEIHSDISEKVKSWEEITILALWDSITYWYKVDIDKPYPIQLENKLRENSYNYSIKNYWVSWDESDDLLARIDEILENNIEADIAILTIWWNDWLKKRSTSEMKENILEIIEKLKAEGHDVKGVDFPYLDYLVPNYYVLTTAEASSNLARYDGVHFGYRSDKAEDVETTYVHSRSEGFGEEVQRRIMMGTFVLSAGYYDAFYTKGLKVRNIIKQKTEALFNDYDFILLPTTPSPAFGIGENIDDPITMYLQDIFTVHANLAGIPAVSLPLGEHSNGLPFGMQLMAGTFQDAKLFEFSDRLMNLG